MISRRDEEIIIVNYIDEEQCRNHPFFGFPLGGRIRASFFVARRLRTFQVRIAPRAANLARIRSAQLIIVRILPPYVHYTLISSYLKSPNPIPQQKSSR